MTIVDTGNNSIRVFGLLSRAFDTAFSDDLFLSWRFLKDATVLFVLLEVVAFAVHFVAAFFGAVLQVNSAVFGGDFVMAVMMAGLLAAYAARVHRFVLLGETPQGFFSFNPFADERTQMFALYFVLLATPAIFVRMIWSGQIVFGDVEALGLISIATNVVLTLAFVRLMLVLPATAIDQDFGFGQSIRGTRGHWLKLFVVSYILAALDIVVFDLMVNSAVAAGQGGLGVLLLADGIKAIGALVTVALFAAYISHVYALLGFSGAENQPGANDAGEPA